VPSGKETFKIAAGSALTGYIKTAQAVRKLSKNNDNAKRLSLEFVALSPSARNNTRLEHISLARIIF
jgi:TRAP-type uncharacterized transport system substrate-binding protein